MALINLLGTSCLSSTSCSIVPRTRGPLSSKRTSSTTNPVYHFRTLADFSILALFIHILHPTGVGIKDAVQFASHRSVATISQRTLTLVSWVVYVYALRLSCGYCYVCIYISLSLHAREPIARSGRKLFWADWILDPQSWNHEASRWLGRWRCTINFTSPD